MSPRRCCECARSLTHSRLQRGPWLSVLEPDGDTRLYCSWCSDAAIDGAGEGSLFSLILAGPMRIVRVSREGARPGLRKVGES